MRLMSRWPVWLRMTAMILGVQALVVALAVWILGALLSGNIIWPVHPRQFVHLDEMSPGGTYRVRISESYYLIGDPGSFHLDIFEKGRSLLKRQPIVPIFYYGQSGAPRQWLDESLLQLTSSPAVRGSARAVQGTIELVNECGLRLPCVALLASTNTARGGMYHHVRYLKINMEHGATERLPLVILGGESTPKLTLTLHTCFSSDDRRNSDRHGFQRIEFLMPETGDQLGTITLRLTSQGVEPASGLKLLYADPRP